MLYWPSAKFYSVLVANGDMTLDEASHRLSEETGLTPTGAADVIADPYERGNDLVGNVFDEVGFRQLEKRFGEQRERTVDGGRRREILGRQPILGPLHPLRARYQADRRLRR